MISTNQFKNGMAIKVDGEIYCIIGFQHVKPGKGGAFVRTKLKNLKNANLIERTFRSGEKFEQVFTEAKKYQFLYRHGQIYHFINQNTLEEIELSAAQLADRARLLKENMEVSVSMVEGTVLEVNLPNFIQLKVEHTEPGLRADTVKNVTKKARLETGAEIEVPLFVKKGDRIKIDTRTQIYVSRI